MGRAYLSKEDKFSLVAAVSLLRGDPALLDIEREVETRLRLGDSLGNTLDDALDNACLGVEAP